MYEARARVPDDRATHPTAMLDEARQPGVMGPNCAIRILTLSG